MILPAVRDVRVECLAHTKCLDSIKHAAAVNFYTRNKTGTFAPAPVLSTAINRIAGRSDPKWADPPRRKQNRFPLPRDSCFGIHPPQMFTSRAADGFPAFRLGGRTRSIDWPSSIFSCRTDILFPIGSRRWIKSFIRLRWRLGRASSDGAMPLNSAATSLIFADGRLLCDSPEGKRPMVSGVYGFIICGSRIAMAGLFFDGLEGSPRKERSRVADPDCNSNPFSQETTQCNFRSVEAAVLGRCSLSTQTIP